MRRHGSSSYEILRRSRLYDKVKVRLPVLVVVLFAFVLRLYFVFFSGLPWYSTDTFSYLKQADAILAHNPISFFPNGYPLLIAGLKLLGQQDRALAWLNVIFSTLTVWLAIEIARRLGVSQVLVGLLVAIYPNQLNYCRLLLTETPAAFLLLAGIWLIMSRKYFVAALVLSIAAMARSSLLPIVPLYLIAGMCFKMRWRDLALYASGMIMVLVANELLIFFRVVLPASNLGSNLLQAVGYYSSNFGFDTNMFTLEQQSHPLSTYLGFATHHPLGFVAQRLDALWELWGPWPTGARSLTAKSLIGLRFPLFVAGCLGAYKNRSLLSTWLLLVPVIVLTIIHTIFYSDVRYTVPMEPILIILALCVSKSNARMMIGERLAPSLSSRPAML